MRRLMGILLLALAAGGCTSVKMVQRDGCWVRRTEKSFGRVLEEVGPCDRAQPKWAQDRLTRLVQECMAQADWRWHSRALEVWSRRLPYPTPQPREDELLRACMDEARTGMKTEQDAAALQSKIGDLSGRVAELSGERDGLRGDLARDHAKLQERDEKLAEWLGKSHEKLSDWLGQAAQKPPGNATASATSTSNSDGQATTNSSNDTGATLASESGASSPPAAAPVSSASVTLPPSAGPAVPAAVAPPGAPEARPAPAEPAPKRKRARRPAPIVRAANASGCELPPGGVTPGAGASAAATPRPPASPEHVEP